MVKKGSLFSAVCVISLVSFIYSSCPAMEGSEDNLLVRETPLVPSSSTFNQDEILLEDVPTDSSHLDGKYIDPSDKRKNLTSLKRTAVISGVVFAAYAATAILTTYIMHNQTLAGLNQPSDLLVSSNDSSLSHYDRYSNCLTKCGYTNPELLVGQPREYFINALLNQTAFHVTEKCNNFNLTTLQPVVEHLQTIFPNQSRFVDFYLPNISTFGHFVQGRWHKHNGSVSVLSLMDVFQVSVVCIAYEAAMTNAPLWGVAGGCIAAIPVLATIMYVRMSRCAHKKQELLADIHYY